MTNVELQELEGTDLYFGADETWVSSYKQKQDNEELDWGDLGAMPEVPDVEIEYQEDDGNSNCDGGGCTI